MATINFWATSRPLKTQPKRALLLLGCTFKTLLVIAQVWPTAIPDMTEKSYYFYIESAAVRECIRAENFQQAKAEAFDGWIQYWDEIRWLNPDKDNHLITNG